MCVPYFQSKMRRISFSVLCAYTPTIHIPQNHVFFLQRLFYNLNL